MIEGCYKSGSRCLIIEDVVTSGSSVLETVQCLQQHGIIVTHAVSILDRGQGATEMLNAHDIKLISIIKLNVMLDTLEYTKQISSEQKFQVENFIAANITFPSTTTSEETKITQYTSQHLSQLKEIIHKKKSNLCLSADFSCWTEILEAAEMLGPMICMLKTHIDCLPFATTKEIEEFTTNLKAISKKHEFLVMEDRKFADIGSTVQKQLGPNSIYRISEWADLVTVHGLPGPGILEVFKMQYKPVGVVLIAEMSSEDNLSSKIPAYKEEVMLLAEKYKEIVVGAVAQQKNFSKQLIQFSPGVSLTIGAKGDGLGQQYCSVENAILERGADVIIVGRGIIKNEKCDWVSVAEQFRTVGWAALRKRVDENI